ncbi:MAG TPA: FAD-binding oxidoreductase [Solirubrobacterales bacterium]|nr:FAD-binding oxidoreductase [Solirubrobacterales bacterium]
MTGPSPWWGWGSGGERAPLSPHAIAMLVELVGEATPTPAVDIDDVALPDPAPIPDAIVDAVGAANVLTGKRDRVRHAAGMSYPDLVRLRTGRLDDAPDAVVVPPDREAVVALLEACAREAVAVVPFGGGTSVVGGVDPGRESFERLVSVDLSSLRSVSVDDLSLTARLGPGLTGADAERELAAHGLTLGHFPQSFERATIGGFAATRSAGQASSGYGRFDALVTSACLDAPAGELRTRETPHTAAGPALREVIVGSEGTLGVITEVDVRVRRAPETRRYEGWIAPEFASGVDIIRRLAQQDALPDVIRVSDRVETRVSLGLAGARGVRRRAFDAYLDLRRRSDGCIVIAGWEGEGEAVARRRALGHRVLRHGGAASLGAGPGRAWYRGRYRGPHLRDELLDLGYMVETLETAHTWSRLEGLYAAVRDAIESALASAGMAGIVFCHLSHAYRDGASLYYTFLAPSRPGYEIDGWRAVKRAACEAIVATGGTITHHHGIGRDHAPYMRDEVTGLGVEALRAVKERLDPTGIMNPGKLLPG